MKNKNILITILIAVIVGGVGFFAGMQLTKSQTNTNDQSAQVQQRGNARFGGRGGNRGTMGSVINQDANSITLQLPDGSSKIVLLSTSTIFVKTDKASASDIKNGDKVIVFGTTNSDGSVTAQNVQLNPPQRQTTPTPTPAQ